MERVEMALKKCSRTENGDDFSVDDLLDFSNDDVFVDEDELKMQRKKEGLSSPSENDDNTLLPNHDSTAAALEDSASLAVPMDDLAELEWLSNFVDDSNFTPSSSAPATRKTKPVWLTGNRSHPLPPTLTDKTPLPPVIRNSKRARTGVKGWAHLLNDSSSHTSTTGDDPTTVRRHNTRKKKSTLEVSNNSDQTQTQTQTGRSCSHCGVQETPQWRTGPLGAKTLCNACGVRFKSGRLLPEYRPASSPTFSSELHSNSHRKVIEMRRQKEMSG